MDVGTQRESFIFHMEYIEGVPQELEAQYAMYAINYVRYGTEPELSDWRDQRMWKQTKQRIDEEAEKYEKRCSNLKHNKQQPKNESTEETKVDARIDIESTSNRERIENESACVSVSEFESDCEFENERESEFVPERVPIRETPSAIEYSNKIFKIFQEAGLPCARNNEISFLQRDFKNAMAYIHNSETLRKVPPDDIIAACENYAKTVNDPQSFITGKYSFDRFVTFKNFTDYLPDNFVAENFKDEKKAAQGETKPRREWLQMCPACKKKSLDYDNKLQKYICKDCGRKFEYEEINT